MPAPSRLSVSGRSRLQSPLRSCVSNRLTPAALTSTRTCPGPGEGNGNSSSTIASGPPCACTRIAFTAVTPKSRLFAAQCEIDRYRRRLEISLAESGGVRECTPIDLAPDQLHAQGVDIEWEGIERDFGALDG